MHPKSLRQLAGLAPPQHLDAAKTALILIDFQREYYDGALPLPEGEVVAAKAAMLVEHADRVGARVIHVHHESASPKAALFTPGGANAAPHPLLQPAGAHRRIVKRLPSSFVGTDLEKQLREAGVERLVICGLMTHMCVDSTTRDAVSLGFQAIVVADACATRDLAAVDGGVVTHAEVQRATLAALADRFADVMDVGALLRAFGAPAP